MNILQLKISVKLGFLMGAALAFGLSHLTAESTDSNVNIVLVLADDLGKGDISFYHRQRTGEVAVPVPTPNIDRLIEAGMRFSDAHSPAALCAPTRFSMLTGNYPYRNGKPDGVWTVHADPRIDPKFTSVGRIAQAANYRTAFFGKWGLGGAWSGKPVGAEAHSQLTAGALSYGFDYALELPAGIQDPPYAIYENRELYKLKPDSEIVHIPIEQTRYDLSIDAKAQNRDGFGDSNWDPKLIGPLMAEKAASFIRNHTEIHPEQPFFLYYCSQAVHTPHAAADELGGKKIAGTTAGPLGDFIYELDAQVGMLVQALKDAGVYENTLFVFTSDNGGLPEKWGKAIYAEGHRSNGTLSGNKGSINEGGHQVPFVAVWPNTIEPNSECHVPIVAHDMVATISALTNQVVDRSVIMDSVDLSPVFLGEELSTDRYIVHQSGGIMNFALRESKWKLIIDANVRDLPKHQRYVFDAANFKPIAFYNMETNPNEKEENNLLNNPEYEQRVNAMFEKFCELLASDQPTVFDF